MLQNTTSKQKRSFRSQTYDQKNQQIITSNQYALQPKKLHLNINYIGKNYDQNPPLTSYVQSSQIDSKRPSNFFDIQPVKKINVPLNPLQENYQSEELKGDMELIKLQQSILENQQIYRQKFQEQKQGQTSRGSIISFKNAKTQQGKDPSNESYNINVIQADIRDTSYQYEQENQVFNTVQNTARNSIVPEPIQNKTQRSYTIDSRSNDQKPTGILTQRNPKVKSNLPILKSNNPFLKLQKNKNPSSNPQNQNQDNKNINNTGQKSSELTDQNQHFLATLDLKQQKIPNHIEKLQKTQKIRQKRLKTLDNMNQNQNYANLFKNEKLHKKSKKLVQSDSKQQEQPGDILYSNTKKATEGDLPDHSALNFEQISQNQYYLEQILKNKSNISSNHNSPNKVPNFSDKKLQISQVLSTQPAQSLSAKKTNENSKNYFQFNNQNIIQNLQNNTKEEEKQQIQQKINVKLQNHTQYRNKAFCTHQKKKQNQLKQQQQYLELYNFKEKPQQYQNQNQNQNINQELIEQFQYDPKCHNTKFPKMAPGTQRHIVPPQDLVQKNELDQYYDEQFQNIYKNQFQYDKIAYKNNTIEQILKFQKQQQQLQKYNMFNIQNPKNNLEYNNNIEIELDNIQNQRNMISLSQFQSQQQQQKKVLSYKEQIMMQQFKQQQQLLSQFDSQKKFSYMQFTILDDAHREKNNKNKNQNNKNIVQGSLDQVGEVGDNIVSGRKPFDFSIDFNKKYHDIVFLPANNLQKALQKQYDMKQADKQVKFKLSWENLSEFYDMLESMENSLRFNNDILENCETFHTLLEKQYFDNVNHVFSQTPIKNPLKTTIILLNCVVVYIIQSYLDAEALFYNLGNFRAILVFLQINYTLFLELFINNSGIQQILTKNSQQSSDKIDKIKKELNYKIKKLKKSNGKLTQEQLQKIIGYLEADSPSLCHEKCTHFTYNVLQSSSQPCLNNCKLIFQSNIKQIQNNNDQIMKMLNVVSRTEEEFNLFSFKYLQDIQKHSIEDNYRTLRDFFALYLTKIENNNENVLEIPFLSIAPVPYLKNIASKPYTLLLDMDETLIHFNDVDENYKNFHIRPNTHYFLDMMSQYYEIVIFTAAMPEYADAILNQLDTNNRIQYRLYRHHTKKQKGVFIKDLERVGREMDKMIIIDNSEENLKLQPQNGICIKSWYGKQTDNLLLELCHELIKIANNQPESVIPFIKELQDKDIGNYAYNNISVQQSSVDRSET